MRISIYHSKGGDIMDDLFDDVDGFLLDEDDYELIRQMEEQNFVPADKEPFHYWNGDYDEETDRDLIPFDEIDEF